VPRSSQAHPTNQADRTHRGIPAFGYAASFVVKQPGTVAIGFAGSWQHGVEVGAEVGVWVVLGCALAGRRRWLDWWWKPIRRKRYGAARSTDAGPPEPDDIEAGVEGARGVGNGRANVTNRHIGRERTVRRTRPPVVARQAVVSGAPRVPTRMGGEASADAVSAPRVTGDGDAP
jgi:hypothetical protein